MFAKDTVVLITKGKYAGQKGVIVEEMSESKGRAVVMVVGLEKAPRPVTEDMTSKQKKKRSEVKGFAKKMNVRHLISTRHSIENVFSSMEIKDISDMSERAVMRKEIEKRFRALYAKEPTNWVFKKCLI